MSPFVMTHPAYFEAATPQHLRQSSERSPALSTPPAPAIDALIASFDIFDTLVVRAVAHPADVFPLVADQLLDQGEFTIALARQWPRHRMKIEAALRAAAGDREIAFDAIISALGRHLGATPRQIKAMQETELRIEASLWQPVPAGLALVEAARQAGKTIVLLSDMYLPAAFIEQTLRALGIVVASDHVIVSSTTGDTKTSGAAYRRLARMMRVAPAQIEHVGDNRQSDVRAALANGVRARHFTDTALSRYEQAIADDTQLPRRTAALLAGATRVARLSSRATPGQKAIAAVASGVIAPMALSFVLWTLHQARARGRNTLCFLARDGQTPYRVAKLIARADRKRCDALSIRYVYASRQAWHSAAIHALDEDDLQWLFADQHGTLTFAGLCRRANVDTKAMLMALPGSLARACAAALDAGVRHELTSALQHDGPARRLVLDAAALARARAIFYLRQEAIGELASTALIDVGWNGTLQRSYERILQPDPSGIIGSYGLYIGLASRPRLAPGATLDAWLYDRTQRRGAWFCPVALIEQFFEADHGTTTGYYIDGHRCATPILATRGNGPALAWGLGVQQEAVYATVRTFLERASSDDLDALAGAAGSQLTERLLDQFTHRPTVDESACFGVFPKTSSQNHDDARPLAPTVGLGDAWRLGIGFDTRLPASTCWPAGSLVRSGYPTLARIRRLQSRLISLGARLAYRRRQYPYLSIGQTA
jgi:FMN phosphatase YigB (HAD superfamily)